MQKTIIFGVALVLLFGMGFLFTHRESQKLGNVTPLVSTDTQNSERATVNNLINLANNFSTTTNNVFTGLQAFSNTGTTTFAGGLYTNLIAAPYFIATSTAATSTAANGWNLNGGCFSVKGTCLTAGGSGTVTSIAFGDGLVGGTISSAGNVNLKAYFATTTADVAGRVVYWGSSSAWPAIFSSVATSTLTLGPAFSYSGTIGNFVAGSSGTLSTVAQFSFSYATSTTMTGTTTIPLQEAILAETINGIRCSTAHGGGGTMNVQLGTGSASTSVINASSTNNFNAYTSNNTVSAGQTLYVDIGTPLNSPSKINCSVKFTI